jgi:hypothetical protein
MLAVEGTHSQDSDIARCNNTINPAGIRSAQCPLYPRSGIAPRRKTGIPGVCRCNVWARKWQSAFICRPVGTNRKGEVLSSERFLLCRPQGGLNDVLCNIAKARIYADKFNRTLIIDTNFVNSANILGDFSDYFHTKANVILDVGPFINKLRDLTTFPACVAGKLHSYRAYHNATMNYFAEQTTSERISFKFNIDYEERLLVHHDCGGSALGVQALSWLQLNDVITTELIRRLSVINGPYCAIHIRNTDYRSDYVRQLNSWKPQLAAWDCANLFVGTDNIECVEYCRKLFSSFNVYSFSWLPQIAHPLHYYSDPTRRFEITADSILDLLMLALSKQLTLMPIERGDGQCPIQVQTSGAAVYFSGYSVLAQNLRSRRDILHHVVPDVFSRVNRVDNRSSQSRKSAAPVVSRNAPCPCNSGRRFKHCCGKLA